MQRLAKTERGRTERRPAKMAADAKMSSASKSDPQLAAKLKADSGDPDEVRRALDEAAGMSRNLWLAFLTFGTYLVIAVGSVTHRDLLLANPIRLPLLNVDLPLVAFFWVAPLLFLVFHAYLLLNLRLLIDNVRGYNRMVKSACLKPEEEDSFRLLLTNFPFVQLLAGSSDTRRGLVGGLLTCIVWITVVLAPIVLLVLMQLQFLPYHNHGVTWVQRGAIIADIVLLCFFWPRIMLAGSRRRARVLASRASGAFLAVLIVFFAVLIATFPGEAHDQNVISTTRIIPTTWKVPAAKNAYKTAGEEPKSMPKAIVSAIVALLEPRSTYDLLFSGHVNEVTGVRGGLWSNTLVLPGEDFVDDEKLDKVERTISLRGRDLRKATLILTDLRKADFTGANLNDANLYRARLDEARFGCGTVGIRSFDEAADYMLGGSEPYYIESADFRWPEDGCSWLLRANFVEASLKKAYLRSARLQGADFSRAQIQEANFYGARLQGAWFSGAHMEGASLESAWLQGAVLDEAKLQGAQLSEAWLQGAYFTAANLDGATLDKAWLHGASLVGANAYGTSFQETHLQGADLQQIQLVGASVNHAFVWRARLDQEAHVMPAKLQGSDFASLETGRRGPLSYMAPKAVLDEDTFRNMRTEAKRGGMLDQETVTSISERLSVLDPSQSDPEHWPSTYSILRSHADAQHNAKSSSYQGDLADALKEMVCRSESAPYALRGILRNGRLKATGAHLQIVLDGLDNPDICPAASLLTEADLLAVRNLQSTP